MKRFSTITDLNFFMDTLYLPHKGKGLRSQFIKKTALDDRCLCIAQTPSRILSHIMPKDFLRKARIMWARDYVANNYLCDIGLVNYLYSKRFTFVLLIRG